MILDEKNASNGFTELKERLRGGLRRARQGARHLSFHRFANTGVEASKWRSAKGEARFHWRKARPIPEYGNRWCNLRRASWGWAGWAVQFAQTRPILIGVLKSAPTGSTPPSLSFAIAANPMEAMHPHVGAKVSRIFREVTLARSLCACSFALWRLFAYVEGRGRAAP